MSRRRTAALVALGLAIGAGAVPLAGPAQATSTQCTIPDARGDGTGIVIGVTQPVYSEPALDLVEMGVEWQQTEENLRFTIEVDDLNDLELPPVGTNGEYFDFNFSMDGKAYGVQYFHSRVDSDQRWRLIEWNPGRVTIADSESSNVTGEVDVIADLITIDIPARVVLTDTGEQVFSLRSGVTVDAFEITSRRELVALVPDVDVAAPEGDGCASVTVGTVAGGADPLDHGDSIQLSGAYTVDAVRQCAVDPCVRESFLVGADSGTLRIELANVVDPTGLSDIDLFLTGTGGSHESATAGNDEVIEIPLATGRVGGYEVSALAHLAVGATFDIIVSVHPPAAS